MLKIRSRYIIKQIFDNIIERRYLSIVKYNKKHQNILNLSIKNYKIYNQIEIELIPISNYEKKIYLLIEIMKIMTLYIYILIIIKQKNINTVHLNINLKFQR